MAGHQSEGEDAGYVLAIWLLRLLLWKQSRRRIYDLSGRRGGQTACLRACEEGQCFEQEVRFCAVWFGSHLSHSKHLVLYALELYLTAKGVCLSGNASNCVVSLCTLVRFVECSHNVYSRILSLPPHATHYFVRHRALKRVQQRTSLFRTTPTCFFDPAKTNRLHSPSVRLHHTSFRYYSRLNLHHPRPIILRLFSDHPTHNLKSATRFCRRCAASHASHTASAPTPCSQRSPSTPLFALT